MNAERLLEHYEKIADAPDAIARLRRFILDLAVRGKLVPQDPNDESAAELLKRIAAEKTRLVKAGKIRNGREGYPELAEPPFELPDNWIWVAFGEVHQLVRGVTYSKSDVAQAPSAGFIPVLRATNIGTMLTHDEPVYVKESCVSADQFLRSGDFMIALSSGSKNLVGKAAFVPDDFREAFGGFCGAIRLFDQSLQGIVRVFLQSDLYRESISEGSRGIGINNLKKETLSNLFFPLPPLAEQHRIVAKVDELMALCDRLEAARATREATRDKLAAASLARLNAPDSETFQADARFALDALPALTARADQIKQLRQTILNLAVRGKLVPQDPNDEPASELLKRIAKAHPKKIRNSRESADDVRLPSAWSLSPLGRISSFENGDRSSNYPSGSDIKAEGVPFFSTKNLSGYRLQFTNLDFITRAQFDSLRSGKLQDQDVLITLRGSVGKFGLFEACGDIKTGFINAQLLIIRCVDRATVPYLITYMRSDHFSEQIALLSSGSATPQLSAGKLAEALIPFPPLAEQHRIVAKADALMALCDRLEASLATADDTRRRLLEALLAEALEPANDCELEAAE